ncbi:MAG: helix-turn-helix domain-containing protein [Clostridia bacterium]|nr:helix-turn-helix domain-containing protein [Clostridia bacterium]
MKQKYSNTLIHQCCTAYKAGRTVTNISTEFHVPRSTIYTWIRHERQELAQKTKVPYFKDYPALQRQITRLKTTIN